MFFGGWRGESSSLETLLLVGRQLLIAQIKMIKATNRVLEQVAALISTYEDRSRLPHAPPPSEDRHVSAPYDDHL